MARALVSGINERPPRSALLQSRKHPFVFLRPVRLRGFPRRVSDLVSDPGFRFAPPMGWSEAEPWVGCGLGYDGVEDVDVVQFSVGNLNKCGDRATQIEQGVHLDGGLVGSKPGPGEQRQAEVDGGGVQGIDGVVEIETERLVGLPGAGDADQHLSEVGEDVPVVRLVGVGQGGA